ncbi:hypothetical protein Mgra_00002667 [Meloidogyne graminicola]|uniref:Uncharacterized protein n=1 Tax=Meloidogyne graminicola TaxID=189291 RepID=A0A8S9ZYH1_9BILA|nr:hypothetical protein Mgra_00002667 [Meloidogyne graminicola]
MIRKEKKKPSLIFSNNSKVISNRNGSVGFEGFLYLNLNNKFILNLIINGFSQDSFTVDTLCKE